MRIVDRYLLREVALAWLAVVTVLLLILVANQLVRYLGDAVAGDLPPEFIASLLGLAAVRYSVLLLPLSLYVAILLVLGRLYTEREMDALFAGGVGPLRLYRPILMLAIPLAGVMGFMALSVVPWAENAEARVYQQAERSADMRVLSAGRFHEAKERGLMFYVEGLEAGGRQMRNVFVQDYRQSPRGLVTARRGFRTVEPDSGERFLVLEDGVRYEGEPGSGDYRITRFQRYRVRLDPREGGSHSVGRAGQPTAALWDSPAPRDRAELQWRLSMPVLVVVLASLAVPLARTDPRQGRYGRLTMGVLLYIVYINLINVGKSWIEQGSLAPLPGLWSVHLTVLALAGGLVVRQLGPRWLLGRLTAPRRGPA